MKSENITYIIIAFLMAFLVLLASIGFSIDMHFCQGKLKTVNFFGTAKSCHDIGGGMIDCPMHGKMKAPADSGSDTIEKKSCCSNKTLFIQSDQDQQFQVDEAIVISQQLELFAIAFVEVFLKPTTSKTESTAFKDYRSPLIPRDIYVLFETYLI